MNAKEPVCVYCERNSQQVPLFPLIFNGEQAWICPQHLPILINEPQQLAGKLPGAENLEPAEGHETK